MMDHKRLYQQFDDLKNKDRQEGIPVVNLPWKKHKLGVSIENYPKFFIYTPDRKASAPNIVLKTLAVEYNISCTFKEDDTSDAEEGNRYTIITLMSDERALQLQFIDVVIMILERLGEAPAKQAIAVEMENLISIFAKLRRAPKKTIQGLWAELLVIETSDQPTEMIHAWHSDPASKYDFTKGKDKIEVKSTSAEVRKHTMSVDQLNPSDNSRLLIASAIVRESGPATDALSVDDLRDRICQRVEDTQARMHLYAVIAATIGTDVSKLKNIYFDYVGGRDSLRFYDHTVVPAVKKEDVGKGVSEVKFVSDFTDLPDIHETQPPYPLHESPLFSLLKHPDV